MLFVKALANCCWNIILIIRKIIYNDKKYISLWFELLLIAMISFLRHTVLFFLIVDGFLPL